MDIDILIFLQNFRNGSGAILADLMQKSAFFGELNTTMALLAILQRNKKKEDIWILLPSLFISILVPSLLR